MQNGNRKGIAQWSKTYAGKKFYTSILFLALPIILLVTFTFIPALDMVIFSFQNRDPYGTNPTYAGFSNYVTIFTDKDYLETFKNSLYYLVGSFIQQALALLLASILCSKIRAKGLFKGILFFPYLMNGVAVSIIFQRFFLKGQKGLTPDGTLNTILTTLGLDPILWFDVDKPFLANCCLVFISKNSGIYQLKIDYQRSDQLDLLIRLMGYGSTIQFKKKNDPIYIEIKRRLECQLKCIAENECK